jgi:hypothetical protein
MALEPHLGLHLDLCEPPGGDRGLDEAHGEFPNLERPGGHSLPRTSPTGPGVVRFAVVLPMLASFRAFATLTVVVVSIPALVVRRGRREVMGGRLPLCVLTDLRHLAAEAVEHLVHLVHRNHGVLRRRVAALGMGSVGTVGQRE